MKFSPIIATLFSLVNLSKNVLATKQEAQKRDLGHVVGGTEVVPSRYNYLVTIVFNDEPECSSQICGGTLIAPGYVLSSAKCSNMKRGEPKVWIGLEGDELVSSAAAEVINVEYMVFDNDHNFLNAYSEGDIMVMKLATNSAFSPVTLADNSADTSGGTAVSVMGWGATSMENLADSSDVLREAELNIVSNSDCDAIYAFQIFDTMMCAAKDGAGFCIGDIGGPVIVKGSDAASDVQVGIAMAFFSACGEGSARPEIYTRVSDYIDFIDCVTGGGSIECGIVRPVDNTKRSSLLKQMRKAKKQIGKVFGFCNVDATCT